MKNTHTTHTYKERVYGKKQTKKQTNEHIHFKQQNAKANPHKLILSWKCTLFECIFAFFLNFCKSSVKVKRIHEWHQTQFPSVFDIADTKMPTSNLKKHKNEILTHKMNGAEKKRL